MPVFQPRGDQPGALLSPDSFTGYFDAIGRGLKDFERNRQAREQERLTGRQVATRERLAEETGRRTDILGRTEDRLAKGQKFTQQVQGLAFAAEQAGYVLDAEGNPSFEGAQALLEGRPLPEGFTYDATGMGKILAGARRRLGAGSVEEIQEIERRLKDAEVQQAEGVAQAATAGGVQAVVGSVNEVIAQLGPEAQRDPTIRAKLTEAFKTGEISHLDGLDLTPQTTAGQKLSEFVELIGGDPTSPEDRAFAERMFKQELVTRPALLFGRELEKTDTMIDLYKAQMQYYKDLGFASKLKAEAGASRDPAKVNAIIEDIDGQIRDQHSEVMGLEAIKVTGGGGHFNKKFVPVDADDVASLLSGPATREAVEETLAGLEEKHGAEVSGFRVQTETSVSKGASKIGKAAEVVFDRETYVSRIVEARKGTAAMAAHLESLRELNPRAAARLILGNPVLERVFAEEIASAREAAGGVEGETGSPTGGISGTLGAMDDALNERLGVLESTVNEILKQNQ